MKFKDSAVKLKLCPQRVANIPSFGVDKTLLTYCLSSLTDI